nr:immunoglobulin light chain junction region [Macaca mulatta]MOX88904.1 immunoglobulin light chain junction region [Macaca mulatta]MOX88977.1 immunoglobulin light chain junction region [Macaca mulatta]MOX89708.1 immunoglobulin light chain junction region [Macaca mulatta]MOX90808.1 immunoglobulin light chain junction region [Macaca mulatta]
CLQTKNSFTF